jgi:hypothetical protein
MGCEREEQPPTSFGRKMHMGREYRGHCEGKGKRKAKL